MNKKRKPSKKSNPAVGRSRMTRSVAASAKTAQRGGAKRAASTCAAKRRKDARPKPLDWSRCILWAERIAHGCDVVVLPGQSATREIDIHAHIKEARTNIAVGLDALARLAEENIEAASVLVDVATALADLATEGAGKVERLWLQGNADVLTMQSLYGDPLSEREVLQRDIAQVILREVARKRMTWPVAMTDRPIDAEEKIAWLKKDLNLGAEALLAVSRERPGPYGSVFREIAVQLLIDSMKVRASARGRTRSGRTSLELALLRLPLKPCKSWVKVLCDEASDALLPDNWPVTLPRLEPWRRSWDGRIIPDHEPKGRVSDDYKLHDPTYRTRSLRTHGAHLLKEALLALLPES